MYNFKQQLFVILLSLLGLHSGIAQTADITLGCRPLEVNFTAPSGANSYFWDFKDGATSTIANPVNTFNQSGVFIVEFSEGVGQPVLGTVTIEIFDKPSLTIDVDTMEGCIPLPVNFENTSTLPNEIIVNNYNWVFGDGNSSEGLENVTHTYTVGGTFTVSLAIETNLESCNVTEIFPDLIAAASPANVLFGTSPNPPAACEPPLTVSFTNFTSGGGENLTYAWDFGNGVTFNGIDAPPQTYNEEGLFPVQLSVSDDQGCEASFTRNVSIGPPEVNFAVPDTVCINDSIAIQNLSDLGNYLWVFGEGVIPGISNDTNPEVRFTAGGMIEINLNVTRADGCSNDTTIIVFVDEPDATFVSDPSYSCSEPFTINYEPLSEDAIAWNWVFYDSTFSTEQYPSFTYINTDTTTYSMNGTIGIIAILTVTNPSGCRASSFVLDTVRQPNALFIPDQVEGCAPLTVSFLDLSTSVEDIVRWEWDFGEGTTAVYTEVETPVITYTEPGVYDVQLNIENSAGCVDTSYVIQINLGEQIIPDFEVDQTEVCPGDSVRFTDLTDNPLIEAWHFETEGGQSFHCFQESEMVWAFDDETGPQDVTLTIEYSGCVSSITKEDLILVKGPVAEFEYEIDCSSPYEVSFSDSSLDTTNITWDFGDGSFSTDQDLVHTYDTTGDYTVILTAEHATSGCPAAKDTALICIRDIQAILDLEDNYCKGQPVSLSAANSIDVNNDCFRGFTWYFEESSRPITTQDTALQFTFPNSGEETITLIVEDINGCQDTAIHELKVFEIEAAFTMDDTLICNPTAVNFMNLSTADTTIQSWSWNFGDGQVDSIQNAAHVYQGFNAIDTFIVTLTVEDVLGCMATDEFIIRAYEIEADMITDPFFPNICVGTEVEFTGVGDNLSYQWDFGNGDSAGVQMTSTTYNEAGSFLVVLNAQELGTGCETQVFRQINVQDYPEAAFISSADNEPILCYPQNIEFTQTSNSSFPLNFNWDFGNGQSGFGPLASASFDKGTYEVELVAFTNYGCADTISRSFTLVGPEGDFMMSADEICIGEIIDFDLIDTVDVSSFTWNFGDGTNAENENPVSHTYEFLPPSGMTFATLVLRGENEACTFVIERPVSIGDVTADFLRNDGIDTTACIGEFSFTNTSTGANLFSWDFGNGSTSNEENPVINFEVDGTYTVQLIAEDAALGCRDTIEKIVEIGAIQNIQLQGDTICPGDTAVLSVLNPFSGASYTWSPASLLDDPTSLNPQTSPEATTQFEVIVIDSTGCEGSATTEVLVIAPPPSFSSDTIVVEGSVINLSGPGLGSEYGYFWNPSTGLSCTDCLDPQLEAFEDASYTLFISDILGCDSSEVIFNIDVIREEAAVPNAFTPDGDGDNDFFNILAEVVPGEGILDVLEFKVYNRWGNLVYDNADSVNGWNGQQNGKDSPSDVYLYFIRLGWNISQTTQEFKGDVTLIR